MKAHSAFALFILSSLFVFACSNQQEDPARVDVASTPTDEESALADSVFCAGTASVLSEISTDTYPELMQWKDKFSTIANNASNKAQSLASEDGSLIDTRLEEIKEQTRDAIESYNSADNENKLSEFVEQSMTQCADFAAQN